MGSPSLGVFIHKSLGSSQHYLINRHAAWPLNWSQTLAGATLLLAPINAEMMKSEDKQISLTDPDAKRTVYDFKTEVRLNFVF